MEVELPYALEIQAAEIEIRKNVIIFSDLE
jgi:hypothetical protein